MKTFLEYFQLYEDTSNDVQMAFGDAESKVKSIFAYLHKVMMNTWGKQAPSWDDQLKNKVIGELQNVIDKLKGKVNKTEACDAAKMAVKESIVLLEGGAIPDWMQGMVGQNRTVTVDRMLNAMQAEVIKILHSLRDEVLVQKVSNVAGSVEKVGRRVSTNASKNIRNVGKSIQNQISQGVKVQQSMSGAERSTAKWNLELLASALQSRPDIKLYSGASGTRQLKFDPADPIQMASVLDKAGKERTFRIKVNGKYHDFDITHEGETSRVIEMIKGNEDV
jgi:hypothetical protein